MKSDACQTAHDMRQSWQLQLDRSWRAGEEPQTKQGVTPQVVYDMNADLSLACHRSASPATSPWDTLCGGILHNTCKDDFQLGSTDAGRRGVLFTTQKAKSADQSSFILCCMEEEWQESQRANSVRLILAVTDLPAGSGHLVAETCPLAGSAAAPCRRDSRDWTAGVKSWTYQSICVRHSQSHCSSSMHSAYALHLK